MIVRRPSEEDCDETLEAGRQLKAREPQMGSATSRLAFALLASITVSPVMAQEVSLYPTDGQSLDQQAIDRAECDKRAVRDTGFDPLEPPAALPSAIRFRQHDAIRQVAPSPLAGVSAYAPARFGVPVGPLPGALFGTSRATELRRQQEMQQRQAAATLEDQRADFKAAMASCLRVRGYIVR
jgi:hypothetical protein